MISEMHARQDDLYHKQWTETELQLKVLQYLKKGVENHKVNVKKMYSYVQLTFFEAFNCPLLLMNYKVP